MPRALVESLKSSLRKGTDARAAAPSLVRRNVAHLAAGRSGAGPPPPGSRTVVPDGR